MDRILPTWGLLRKSRDAIRNAHTVDRSSAALTLRLRGLFRRTDNPGGRRFQHQGDAFAEVE